MKYLEDIIREKGKVLTNDVLKVNSFLNHALDAKILDKLAQEWYNLFRKEGVTKIVTIESSGIALAILTALKFDVPVVFAKKSNASTVGDAYVSTAFSFTRNVQCNISIEKQFLTSEDKILILDDFLANGQASKALIDIANQASATIVGFGFAIEKGHQDGGKFLREKGYRVESLAIIESMDATTGQITFR